MDSGEAYLQLGNIYLELWTKKAYNYFKQALKWSQFLWSPI